MEEYSQLKDYRKSIDEIDKKICELVKERIEIVKKVGRFKAENNIPVRDERRINAVYENFAKNSGLSYADAKKIYSPLIDFCIKIEEDIIENMKKDKKN